MEEIGEIKPYVKRIGNNNYRVHKIVFKKGFLKKGNLEAAALYLKSDENSDEEINSGEDVSKSIGLESVAMEIERRYTESVRRSSSKITISEEERKIGEELDKIIKTEEQKRFKSEFTHFVNFPLIMNKEFIGKCKQLKEKLINNPVLGIDSDLFDDFSKMHFTICVLPLHTEERVKKAIEVINNLKPIIYEKFTNPIKVSFRGIDVMNKYKLQEVKI